MITIQSASISDLVLILLLLIPAWGQGNPYTGLQCPTHACVYKYSYTQMDSVKINFNIPMIPVLVSHSYYYTHNKEYISGIYNNCTSGKEMPFVYIK